MNRYKKYGIALLLAVSSFLLKAEKVQVGNLFYEINDETLTAEVTYNFEKV